MFRTLLRSVWLTSAQRRVVLLSAEQAVGRDEEYPGQSEIVDFLDHLRSAEARADRPGHLVSLVVRGLRLPKDARPVRMSDEIVDLLIIWGNLPESIARLATPQPRVFPESGNGDE